jgi:hypothetical protein
MLYPYDGLLSSHKKKKNSTVEVFTDIEKR